jgi:ketosteroid isomerase-like protein
MNTAGLILTLLVGMPGLAAASAADDLQKSEKAWAAAVVARDFPALEKVFADELIYAHATGNIDSKQQYLDRLRKGAQRYDAITHENIRVVPYGDSAVAHSMVRMKGVSNGRPFDDHVMMLHLWVKQGGNWRLAAHQTTKVP